MANADATKEHAPVKRSETPSGRHPRPRIGATAKKRKREMARRDAATNAPAPAATAQKNPKKKG